MSHSRIFQTSKNPIPESDVHTEDRYFDCQPLTADYVVESDLEDDLGWLARSYPDNMDVDVDAKTITFKGMSDYKAAKLRNMADQADRLARLARMAADNIESGDENAYDGSYKADQEEPAIDQMLYRLSCVTSDPTGFWADDDYYGMLPLDEWMFNMKDGDVVHVGATFDYHS